MTQFKGPSPIEFPPDLISGDTNQRLRVDQGEPGFWEGRQFRIAYEFDLDVSASELIFIRVTFGTDVILTKSELNLDQGGVKYSLVAGGTPGGTWSNSVPVIPKNTMSGTPAYTSQAAVDTGGTVTGGTISPVYRIRTATGTSARSSGVSTTNDPRGFAAGTYYLRIEQLVGVNDDCLGILNLEWEERP